MTPRSYLIATNIGHGAVPDHFLALGQELQKRGNQVAVLTSAPETAAEAAETGLRVHVWPNPRPVTLRDARFLMNIVSRHKPDCAVANFGAVNLFALVHWFKRVPVRIVWYHTLSTQINSDSTLPRWRIRLLRWRKSLVYSTATHLFANSQAASEDMQRTFHVPESKCSVQTLSLADPVAAMATRRPGNGGLKIICVGRFSPSKGQDTLVQALAGLRDQADWTAVMVGEGPNRQAVEKLAQKLGVANRCRFTGLCPHSDVLKELADSSVSVIPSRAEAFGFVALESMAVGLPVIASNTGGLAEVIRDGVDGFLVPPGDAQAISEKLALLLRDPALRTRMGDNARARFLAKFERSRVIPQQADLLEKVTRRE
jgi:glycosyltransferase involved in cell wall biosynthesis